MKSRKKKTWVYSPPKRPKPKVPDEIKQKLQEKGNEIVETIFKPEYIKPLPEQLTLNHIIDIYTKWYRNYFYFCSKYKCPPDAISSSFESKFARMEYIDNDKFELSYMRHTEKWWPLKTGSIEDCLKIISTMVPYTDYLVIIFKVKEHKILSRYNLRGFGELIVQFGAPYYGPQLHLKYEITNLYEGKPSLEPSYALVDSASKEKKEWLQWLEPLEDYVFIDEDGRDAILLSYKFNNA